MMDFAERKIVVEANEDLILDCALKWHKVSYGTKKYAFYRVGCVVLLHYPS